MEKLSSKLPNEFVLRMKSDLGSDFEKYIDAFNDKAVRGLRVNTKKITVEDFLKNFNYDLKPINYSSDGFIFNDNQKIGGDIAHLAGLVYMQEPSSMLAVCASGIESENRPLKILDLCASPGGKTGQIVCRVSDDSIIISNEIVKSRADVLYSNIERQGFKNVVVTSETPESFLLFENYFDYVFVDAPCSGEGMFRKNPETIGEWSKENVKMCQNRQKQILDVATKLVAPNGILVYSTCTFSSEEDEDIVKWLVNSGNFEIQKIPSEIANITKHSVVEGQKNYAVKFYPYLVAGEGQFVAVLKKISEENKIKLYKKKHFKSIERAGRSSLKLFEQFVSENLIEKIDGKIYQVGSNLFLAPNAFDETLQTAFDELKFVSIGTKLGSITNGRFEPNHAIFIAFDRLFKHRIELDEVEIKKYLHGEELVGKTNVKGYAVVMAKGYALGGVRLAGGKLKNLYPKGLRN